ncbi:MAG: CAP domain-containing protein, partial [Actinomycetota bacterium]
MTIARGGLHRRRAGGVPRALFCLALMLLTVGLTPAVASAAVTNASANSQNMLQFMNAERKARGLPPLARDPRLDALAQSWANKMAAARTMYHPGTPQAMSGAGYRSGAQNLAWHDTVLTGAWAHNFWMNSSPHRKNILDPAFTHTGIAMACNPSGGRSPYVF